MFKLEKYFFIALLLLPIVAKAQKKNSSQNSVGGKVIYSAHVAMLTFPSSTVTLIFNQRKSIFRWQFRSKKEYKKHLQENTKETMQKSNQKDQLIYSNADMSTNITLSNNKVHSVRRLNLYNIVKDSLYSRRLLLGHVYLIKEPKPKIHWNITDSIKMIGNFTTIKATAHFRGRDYTAWFTPEIPVPYGPWKLVGLPGLILQAYDSQKNIYFSANKVMLNKHVGSIGPIPLSGREKTIGLAEYKKIMTRLTEKIKKRAVVKVHKYMRKVRSKYPNAYISSKSKWNMDNVVGQMEMFSDNTDN